MPFLEQFTSHINHCGGSSDSLSRWERRTRSASDGNDCRERSHDVSCLMRMPLHSMFDVRCSMFGVCFLFAIPSTLHAQTYQGRQLVKAELLADTNAIVPGKSFTAGLLLRMAPGWHTYWKYAGDAGLPTEIKWNLPPGWRVGEIQWPIPLKTNDPGDIQTYGYQDEVLLIQAITPPADVGTLPVKLSAQADWLVCEKICIPGNA